MIRIVPASDPTFKGVPYVGCPATIHVGTDSYPGTVSWVSEKTIEHTYLNQDGMTVKVELPKSIRIRDCQYKLTAGDTCGGPQEYLYYEDDEKLSEGQEWSYRPIRGNYVQVGTSSRSSAAQPPGFGYRRAYRDPHF